MKIYKRFFAGALAFLSLTALLYASEAPTQPSKADIYDWADGMTKATIEQRDSVALPLALKILHFDAPPTQASSSAHVDPWDQYQRDCALQSLKSLDALDEYLRKVKLYYKDDRNNLKYDWLMAEGLDLEDPNAAIPYWTQAHRLAPDEERPIDALSDYYESEHNNVDLMSLIDPLIERDLALPLPLSTDVVGLYTQQNKLDRLVQLYVASVAKTHLKPNTYLVVSGDSLEKKLRESNRIDDLIAIDRAWLENDPNNRDRRVALTELLQRSGKKDDEKSQLLALIFPPDSSSSPPKTGRWSFDDIPDCELLDNIRRAQAAGLQSALKARAEFYHQKNPGDFGGEQALVLILAVGHNPELRQLLPSYYEHIREQMANYPQDVPPPVVGIYAVFGELIHWPEGKDLVGPALDAALVAEKEEKYADPYEHLSKLAIDSQDQALAQRWLRTELAATKDYTSYGLSPHPTPGMKSADEWVRISRQLIEVRMPKELDSVIDALADPKRSACSDSPDSRSTKLAIVAKAAFDAGMKSQAQHGAKIALKQLQTDWRNPQQTGYSMVITPLGIHLTAELLLRLGLDQDFNTLRDLLSGWSTADSLNRKGLLTDVDRMNERLGKNPTGLTPGLWLDAVADAKDGSEQRVVWDLSAEGAGHLNALEAGVNMDSPPRLAAQSITSFLSVDGLGLPQMDGKYSLQILAGSSGDDLRVIKTVQAAASRGETQVELKPSDRVMKAIGQTTGDQPQLFLGPLVPISQGLNLIRSLVSVRYFSADGSSLAGDIPPTYQYVEGSPSPGGPAINGSFRTANCPENIARMELVGTRQKIVPQSTYLQSGWVKGSGQWGVHYLDADGNKIAESMASFQGQSDGWHFLQQAITIPGPDATSGSPVPTAAVEMEPVLMVPARQSVQYQNLYFGAMESPPSPSLPNPSRSDLMAGLQGATSIVEAPQGNFLAAIFENGEVRCFDLSARREMGIPCKLPGKPVDVGFLNHGTEIVAVDDQGDILVRDVNGTMPGKVVYQVPWKIECMAVSDGSIIAVGNRNQNFVSVIDLAAAKEISQVHLPSLPLIFMVMSPDGEKIYCDTPNLVPGIWNASNGHLLPLSANPPLPYYPSTLPPFNSPLTPRPLNLPPLNPLSIARLFRISPIVEIRTWQRPAWLDVKSGVYVTCVDSSLVYGMSPNAEVFCRVETGPITAACLSTQSADVYAVNVQGTLSAWKLPPDVEIPPPPTTPTLQIGLPANPVKTILPTMALNGIIVTATEQLRGFPQTTLTEPLDITVGDNFGNPIAGARIHLKSEDLHNLTFTSADKITVGHLSSPDFMTDQKGDLRLIVRLGPHPQKGTFQIVASYNRLKSERTVSLEAIDEKAELHQPKNVLIIGNGGEVSVSWQDEADNRTGFVIQRRVNNGPWRAIALASADSTSYQDRKFIKGADNVFRDSSLNYYYRVTATNDATYGFPPKLPPSPDRLDDFVP
jgi:hypothetical protein